MKGTKAKIVVVGSLNMDLVITASSIPIPGETILGDSFFTVPGGKGNNQAITAGRLGAQVHMIGCIGNDDFGQQLINELKRNKVDTSNVEELVDKVSGVALITVGMNAENSIVVAPGANHSLTPQHINHAEAIIKDADVLLVQLETPIGTVMESLVLAKKHGVTTVLNPAPGLKLPEEIFQYVDYLTPNETEIKMLLSYPVDHLLSDNELGKKLTSLKVPNVIITKGKNGAVLWRGKHSEHYSSFKVQARDTTAAGDAFNGALSVALAEGKSIENAIRFAQKVASITVTKQGSSASLPYRSEVDN